MRPFEPRTLALTSLLLLSAFLSAQPVWNPRPIATGEGAGERFRVVQLVEGLSRPWSLAFLGRDEFLISERAGRLWRISPSSVRPVRGLPPIRALGQGGLLDLALHPDFARTRWVYFTFSQAGPGGVGTALGRGRLGDDRLEEVQILFSLEPKTNQGVHFGSRLLWLRDGTLLMSVGDRGERQRAQDPADAAGSILRFTEDGQPAPDNPRRGHPAVWAKGLRNVQGLALHPVTGQVYASEHGPLGGDEINRILPGRNYGWPLVTSGREYSGATITPHARLAGYEDPLWEWSPSLAPSGLAFVTGRAFPRWEGMLLSGNLVGQRLVGLWLEGERVLREEQFLRGTVGRIRDVRVDAEGLVYLVTDNGQDGLYRLEPLR